MPKGRSKLGSGSAFMISVALDDIVESLYGDRMSAVEMLCDGINSFSVLPKKRTRGLEKSGDTVADSARTELKARKAIRRTRGRSDEKKAAVNEDDLGM